MAAPEPDAPLPRLLLVADGFATGRPGASAADVARRAEALVRAGVRLVLLRDHAADARAYAAAAEALAARLRTDAPEVRLLAHTFPDVAAALGAGLHVGRRGPGVAEARARIGPEGLLSAAAHDAAEAHAAAAAGADLVLFSPVFATTSKPGAPAAGPCALGRVAAGLHAAGLGARVFALGGVTPARVGACRAQGAYGVAVLSGLLGAPDPAAAAHAYRVALGEGVADGAASGAPSAPARA
ncbi:MAG: thiamine phosphate synthase [Rubricoccaceae bacterium]